MEHRHLKILGASVREYVLKFTNESGGDLFDDDAGGSCAIVSNIIYETIKLKFDNVMFYMCDDSWGGHCWVRLGNTVIDVSATQFGVEDEVLIEPFSKYRCRSFYKGKVYTNTQALDIVNSLWVAYQRPETHRAKVKHFIDKMQVRMDLWYPRYHAHSESVNV